MQAQAKQQAMQAQAAPWHGAFTRAQLAHILRQSDARAWFSLALNWALSGAAFALAAAWPNPLSIVAALFILGGRQLGLAVLMHDAAHRVLLRGRARNDFAGQWLCAYPIWSELHGYRRYHLQHHAHTGGAADPDLQLVQPFPISGASLRRKVLRDLTGRTGLKFARAAVARSFGRWRTAAGRRTAAGFVITNLALLLILTVAGHAWLYLLWPAAWLTTYTLASRIRAIAEHALTPAAQSPAQPLLNTRTTLLRWWERLLFGPHRVNYHLEHHLLMTAPHYRLPALHKLLCESGMLNNACVERGGYAAVLRRAASAKAAA